MCGTHENNTDTIIIAHANEQGISLISLPRDLFYRGRKINRVFQDYGLNQFTKEIAEITGLKITKYISIDMYAFIDAVNILGGIDVTLDSDLIDPSYKIKEKGIWTTLCYKKGTHHLSGLGALRVARSRHYSPVFDRDKRQQKIIAAVKVKLSKLSVTDVSKFYNLIQTLLKYVNTNFNTFELGNLFLKYKDKNVKGQHVINTSNILYQTYSGILYLKENEKEKQFEEGFNKGAWIVLPKGNDWNVVKWYIRKIVKSD